MARGLLILLAAGCWGFMASGAFRITKRPRPGGWSYGSRSQDVGEDGVREHERHRWQAEELESLSPDGVREHERHRWQDEELESLSPDPAREHERHRWQDEELESLSPDGPHPRSMPPQSSLQKPGAGSPAGAELPPPEDIAKASANGSRVDQGHRLLVASSSVQSPIHSAELAHLAQPKSLRPIWFQQVCCGPLCNASSIRTWVAEVWHDLAWKKEQATEWSPQIQRVSRCLTVSCADGCGCGWRKHCNRATQICNTSLRIMVVGSVIGFFVLGITLLILRTYALRQNPEYMTREQKNRIRDQTKPRAYSFQTFYELRMQSPQSDASGSQSVTSWPESESTFRSDLTSSG